MSSHKEALSEVAGIVNWSEFEEFIRALYAKVPGAVEVTRNYRTKGASGRAREVDVLVKFGLQPHTITLGIECKHWEKKVDGDVIDVVAGKKEDLGIDKFAVVTVAGYEAGAELYALSKGIDLFVVRPSNDDDFGYSGKLVKFKLLMQGSRPANIVGSATLQTDPGGTEEATEQLNRIFSDATPSPGQTTLRPEAMVRRYSAEPGPGGIGLTFLLRESVGDLREIVERAWSEHNQNFWTRKQLSRNHEIRFKAPSALLLSPRNLAVLNHVQFDMEYYVIETFIEVDRGEQFPVVLENVIEGATTPLRATPIGDSLDFTMAETSPKTQVDYSIAPPGVIGREGATIVVTLLKPLDLAQHAAERVHKLVVHDDGRVEWKQISGAST